jgi:hypothetical protein
MARVRWALLAGVVALGAAYWVIVAQPRVTGVEVEGSVPLRVLAVRPNNPSLAVIDLEAGTVTAYPPWVHALPGDAVDGAVITPRRDTIIWMQGTARLFTHRLNKVDRRLRPDPLRQIPGVAPSLYVVPAVDGGAVWLVQPGLDRYWDGDVYPTLVERVALDTGRRTLAIDLDPNSFPVGATGSGLVLNTRELVDSGDGWESEPGSQRVVHVSDDGTLQEVGTGSAFAASPSHIVRFVCPPANGRCDLHVSAADGSDDQRIPRPRDGRWYDVGGPTIPSDAMPVATVSPDGSRVLVAIGRDLDVNGKPNRSTLFAVSLLDGSAEELIGGDGMLQLATWSHDGHWVALIDRRDIRLVNLDDPQAPPLTVRDVIPPEHFPSAAG